MVISNHALEHTLAPLDELRELLPGPEAGRPPRAVAAARRLAHPAPRARGREPPPLHLDAAAASNLLDEAGFEVRECRVVTHAWPRFHDMLFKRLPRPAFDVLARAWAVLRRRRQVMALAERPS